MDFKHGIIGFKDRGDKNYVDENLSNYGTFENGNCTSTHVISN